MVYILTEDSTSGYDFIKTTIERVIKPTVPWTISHLNGCKECNKFLRNLQDISRYRVGDVLLLYFDSNTVDLTDFKRYSSALKKIGVRVYLQSYFCFESVLFSYSPFFNGTFNFGKYQPILNDFRKCLQSESKNQLSSFKQKYAALSLHSSLEECANAVFSLCTYTYPCVHVTKSGKYSANNLDTCLKRNTFNKYYYNNKCNNHCFEDRNSMGVSKCNQLHKRGFCKDLTKHRKDSAILRKMYNETVLCDPFKIIDNGELIFSKETLFSLLRL
jgi:hypothetical protein